MAEEDTKSGQEKRKKTGNKGRSAEKANKPKDARPVKDKSSASAVKRNNKKNNNGRSKEEERRRRVILGLWLLMFSILTGVFVFLFLELFGLREQAAKKPKCLTCHEDEMSRQLAAEYKHEPFDRERCTECHKNIICNKDKKIFAVLKGSLKSICFACHSKAKSEEGKKFVHKPYEGKRCTDCHEPHGSEFEKLTVLPTTELCVSCHYGSSFTQVFQHQPAQMRNCIDCHEPHASDYQWHLALDVGDLCYSCHLRVAQQVYRPIKHEPFGLEECLSCHKPHSAGEEILLSNDYNDLCQGCHEAVKAEFSSASHHPLGSAPMETCGRCHLYHTADYAKLLPMEGTVNCYESECHPELKEVFDSSEHNSNVMDLLAGQSFAVNCSACHSPHGSDYSKMLTQSRYSVCSICHDFPGEVGEHPVFTHVYSPPYEDPWHGGYMWCGSCHAFHGSPYPTMRLASGDDLCLQCHDARQLENTFR